MHTLQQRSELVFPSFTRHESCNHLYFGHRYSCPSFCLAIAAESALLQNWIDQRQICCRIKALLHRYWIDRHHHFQRRGCVHSKNVASARCSVRTAHHHVRMDYGLSLIERDITTHPNHFVLTDDGNLLVHFALRVEPSHRCSIQCSDSGEMSTRYLILLRKLQQSGKSLVSLIEDDRILFRWFSRVQPLNLHLGSFAPRNGFRRRDIFAGRLLRMRNHACDPNQCQKKKSSCHRFSLTNDLQEVCQILPSLLVSARRFPIRRKVRKLHILSGMSWLRIVEDSLRKTRMSVLRLTHCPHVDGLRISTGLRSECPPSTTGSTTMSKVPSCRGSMACH